MDLFIPYILAHLLNNVVGTENTRLIIFWGAVMVVCSIIAVSFNIIANRIASAIACDCTRQIRHDLFSGISYLSSAQTDRLTIASLESRLTSDTYNVNQMIGMMLRLGIRAPILVVGGVIVTVTLDPLLTLVMLATLPFIYFIVRKTSSAGIPLYVLLQKKVDGFTRVLREDAAGIRVIKALSKTDHEKARFDAANREAVDVEKKAGITMARINPVMTFIMNAGMCAVIVAGALLVSGGKSQPGTIIAFMSYFTIIANALINISRIFVNFSKGSASMKRIDEVLSLSPELWVDYEKDCAENEEREGSGKAACEESGKATCEGNKERTAVRAQGAGGRTPFIEFRNVTFSYSGKDSPEEGEVLKNVSFTLEKGQTLGIIGQTGSGKSTIISLLMRFYDADEGQVLINGADVRKIPTKKLRAMFGAVFQNDFIFADTISENIKFGRDIDDDKMIFAAKQAQAYDFITSKEGAFEHQLEIKGANLSGGQKQRLLISRALAADPDILVLDDSSSALDYKTDSLLRAALRENFTRSTTVIVAQRVSAIANADKIIVLSEGKIIGMGKHEELLSGCSVYADISRSQMGGAVLE